MDVVGPANAKEIFFTGRMFSAQEALGMGLINRVVPDAELDAYVDDYCKPDRARTRRSPCMPPSGTIEETDTAGRQA